MLTKRFLATTALTAMLATVMIGGAACATKDQTVIIDRPTPSGEVPPPAEQAPAVEPYRPDGPVSDDAGTSSEDLDKTVAAFKATYGKSKQPRIAIYVNRILSGEVREWDTAVRTNLAYEETSKKVKNGKETTKDISGTASAAIQTPRPDDSEGAPLDEQWAWRVEDGIQSPLLEAGAELVDRKVIMRLAAAASGPGAADVSVKNIEVSALKGHADILAEITISRAPDRKHGYIYRVRAYEVDSGRVLATTSSVSWPKSRRSQARGELVATDTGYERLGYANPETLGAWLAEDLMRGLQGAL